MLGCPCFIMANFHKINSIEELDAVFHASNERPVIVLKHSVTCPISAAMHNEVSSLETDVNVIVVQNGRDVSEEMTRRTGIRHESPQAFVLRDGKVVYNASHYDITADEIGKNMQ
jgi:bacillithiol system protein YtxJ